MNDQPKPMSEWTAETVSDMAFPSDNGTQGWQRIADAHNAAIAAEREKAKDAQDEAFAAYAEADAIQEQLAAEREKVQTLVDALRQIGLLANSVGGDSPYLKLNAIANRCSKEVALYPLPDGRTK